MLGQFEAMIHGPGLVQPYLLLTNLHGFARGVRVLHVDECEVDLAPVGFVEPP